MFLIPVAVSTASMRILSGGPVSPNQSHGVAEARLACEVSLRFRQNFCLVLSALGGSDSGLR